MLFRALAMMGAGFLLSVLWFDLKFDTYLLDVLFHGSAVQPEQLGAIQTYYQRVLSTERQGFPLVAMMMVLALVGVIGQCRQPGLPLWSKVLSLVLLLSPITLAAVNIMPNARVLAFETLPFAQQALLAVSVLQNHLLCFASIGTFLLLQLWLAYRQDRVSLTLE